MAAGRAHIVHCGQPVLVELGTEAFAGAVSHVWLCALLVWVAKAQMVCGYEVRSTDVFERRIVVKR